MEGDDPATFGVDGHIDYTNQKDESPTITCGSNPILIVVTYEWWE